MSDFYKDYQKQVEKAAKENSLYNPLGEVRKTINSLLEKSNTSSQTPTITGTPESAIKKNVQNGLSKMNGEDYSHLFDGIDDETIKKGTEMAKSAIDSNKRKKAYVDTPLEKMPYMQDAMTMYYASIMSDNRTAAKLARSLAYSVHEPESTSLSQKETPKSDSRYVNDEKGVRFRGSPGLSGNIFGTLSAGTEVKYTGNKIKDVDGYNWAEVEYDGKRGYIADKYLATSNQYEKDEPVSDPREKVEKKDLTPLREKTEEKGVSYLGLPQMKNKTFYEFLQEQFKQKDEKPEENKEPSVESSTTEKPKEENKEEKPDSRRYVGTDTMKVFKRASWQSPAEITLSRGDEVEFTGKKETVGSITYAQVKVGDKTGWVFANYLKTDKEQTKPKHKSTVDLSDHKGFQEAFLNVNFPYSTEVGDYDGVYGLQCVDVVKWFVDTYTTLDSCSGNGCEQVEKIASQKKDLSVSTIPCAPAIYSVAGGKHGPGIAKENVSHQTAGHTGIVLDVKVAEDSKGENASDGPKYYITVFHTYNKLGKEGFYYNSDIRTYEHTPNENVTFVDISNYMK